VVTGHEAAGKGESTLAWDRLATGADTLVFLMGAGNLSSIVAHLVANGRPVSTPIALVHRGTTPHQRTLVGTLGDIMVRAEQEGFQPPVVIVVGEVVRLRDRLRWFDSQPLFGKRILVTRSRGQASVLSSMLAERGACPVEMPVISIQAAPDMQELDQAICTLPEYDWVVFTSVNGVEAFSKRMKALELDARHLAGGRIAAIGEATAAALEKLSLRADYVPQEYTSDGLLAGLKDMGVRERRFLLLRADIAGRELAEGLRREGATVHDVAAYRTVTSSEGIAAGREALLSGQIDVVTFTSSSTVRNLVAALNSDSAVLASTVVACIGPVTARTACDSGLRVDVVADRHTIPGLVEALEQYLQHTVMREGI
jgi:uroporphyrinogen III methyltransferase/synthase